jgi:hypothetical protein
LRNFFTDKEDLDLTRFETVGVIQNKPIFEEEKLNRFEESILSLRKKKIWTKDDIVDSFFGLLPEFAHMETGRYLDQRM